MNRKKKELKLYGQLMRPILVGKSAVFTSGGQIFHTSRVVALHEQTDDYIHFETVNTHYRLSTRPFPQAAALLLLPKPLAACA